MESNSRLKNNIYQLRDILLALLPESKKEIWILLISIVFYTSYSLILAVNTSVIDYKDLLYDVYFSFDNPIIYRQGYVYLEGHPLMMFMTMPFIALGNILAGMLGYKAKTVFLAFICTVLISFSIVYVYRYLVKIIELKGYITYLLTAFYAFTSTCLILAFTPESFTITAFFLTFTLYFYSYYIKNKQRIHLAANTLFPVILGGITITNFAKGIIPMLFTDEKWKTKIRKIAIVSVVFLLIIVWIQIQYDFISLIKMRLDGNIRMPARGTYPERVFDWLFAAPILFPELMMFDIKVDGQPFGAISLDFYHHWWQYAFSVTLLGGLAYSVFKNYKNVLVQIIILLLLEDIVIHAVIMYGLRDGFIYGGHWVFLVPILIGWLYKSFKEQRHRTILTYISAVFVVFLITNNLIRLYDFIQLSLNNFPPY